MVTTLHNLIKCNVKALKPYALQKTYSMAVTFEVNIVELAKEKRSSFEVSCRHHNNGGRDLGIRRGPKDFYVRKDKTTRDQAEV